MTKRRNGLDRRRFLAAAAAAGASGAAWSPAGSPAWAAPARTLTAAPAALQIAPPPVAPTAIWAYDGAAPGPELRYRQGDALAIRLENRLPAPTTIHWHGLRLPNAMDGVPGISQAPVAPGAGFDYAFALKDAGTFWYHPHVKSYEQVARGLYGALVVEEPTPPGVDHDLTLVLDDWRFDRNAQLATPFGALHDRAHAGRIGNVLTVNGRPDWRRATARRERLRLRLVNAATARIFSLGARGFSAWVVALDGHPLAAPRRLDRLALAPAQRADLIVDPAPDAGDEAFLLSFERDGGYALATFALSGAGRAEAPAAPAPLPPNPVPPLGDLRAARTATLRMEGGARGGLAEATLGGERLGIRDLARRGKVWAFNGRADPPEAPLVTARLGETVAIAIANDTRWPHAMHLHGHHFRRVGGVGGAGDAGGAPGPLRDTLLMRPGERAVIAFVADNPGDWLLHCHMLAHAAAGMSTWLRVTA